ncbi:hypothetical protein RHS01_10632 [Rhizoctonia solani]|uniref:Uncharacterized protein n=1 Tax=Rhizoctonia solani TaxID=456999 RepID=A0A8H7M290_9AGAM|nr:hypothetical protein RHS01_10632 [Rhizoctonia solani]
MSVVDVNLALTYSLRDDAFANALAYANRRKRQFDKKARVVNYEVGDLVQRYDARLDETHSALRKLAPKCRPRWQTIRPGGTRPPPQALRAESRHSTRRVRRQTEGSPAIQLPRSRGARPAQIPRPEERIPLEREDPTQPNKYQDEDSDDEDLS